MILDKESIALLRAASRGGWAIPSDLASRTGLDPKEAGLRLKALEQSGVISRFKLIPFLPALEGDVWGRYVIRLHKLDTELEKKLEASLAGLEESIHNACFFTRRFPHTSFFCFSRTIEELKLTLRELSLEEEPLLAREYNFPFKASLSDEERLILRVLNSTGETSPVVLAGYLGKDTAWVEAKLSRLLLHTDNPQGVAILKPTIRWYKIDNFIHAHVLMPYAAKANLPVLCAGREWNILAMPLETSETVAIEADFNGWGDFAEWKERCELKGFAPQGFALFAEERVHGKGFEF